MAVGWRPPRNRSVSQNDTARLAQQVPFERRVSGAPQHYPRRLCCLPRARRNDAAGCSCGATAHASGVTRRIPWAAPRPSRQFNVESSALATPGCLLESCVGIKRWVLEHAGPVLDQLDTAVEGAVVDHLEGDVRVAVVDAFCARGAGDH